MGDLDLYKIGGGGELPIWGKFILISYKLKKKGRGVVGIRLHVCAYSIPFLSQIQTIQN